MKKKLLALLLATTMSMALFACGGNKEAATKEATTEEAVVEETAEETVAEETTGDYTEEQSAFVDEFNTMVDDYNVVVEAFNATPELVENQELSDMMNEITACIDEAAEIISDPANLTAEVMDSYRAAFANTYDLMASVEAYIGGDATAEVSEEKAAMQAVFTSALAGTDEVDNTYFFLCDEELTFGAFVVLSADGTQSINVVGEITSREEDGALVITDETTSTYAAFTTVEQGEDYIVIAVEGANEVTLVNWDLEEAIDVVLAIDETTEILE